VDVGLYSDRLFAGSRVHPHGSGDVNAALRQRSLRDLHESVPDPPDSATHAHLSPRWLQGQTPGGRPTSEADSWCRSPLIRTMRTDRRLRLHRRRGSGRPWRPPSALSRGSGSRSACRSSRKRRQGTARRSRLLSLYCPLRGLPLARGDGDSDSCPSPRVSQREEAARSRSSPVRTRTHGESELGNPRS
jgi:hypothetical protein